MITVERIRIEEFRGVRDLTVDLGNANFAVCGPNGTGKSGIVDALEFGLTGTISRLVGKGSGTLSVKEHGPHVNSRTHPEKALVTLEVLIPSLGKRATITRNVKSPKVPKITPDDPEILAVFKHMQRHPEFVLSRREIIKYVLAEPGVRAQQVQALLQLDELDATRKLFFKISSAMTRDLKVLEGERDRAATHLATALGIAEVRASALLSAVNVKRATLAIPALTKLEAITSLRDGLDSQTGVSAPRIPKVQAKTDIANGLASLEAIKTPETGAAWSGVVDALIALKENEAKLSELTRDGMLTTALALFDEEHCPVCETEWEPAKFRAVVGAQRDQLKAVAAERKRIEELIEPVAVTLEGLRPMLRQLAVYARDLPTPLAFEPFEVVAKEADRRAEVLRNFLPLDDAIAALDTNWEDLQPALSHIAMLSASVEVLPEPTDRDAARDFLTVGQERLESWRQAMTRYAAGRTKADAAAKVYALYGTSTDKALEAIYKEVEAEFRSYYRDINGDDESKFEAQLTPSLGKLGFQVDFYGKGFFPPGAYHSEGHQDGMGLCLYLDLMNYLLGNQFTFAVLDDVLMSVDAGHRREVCTLLKTKFPKTQFVLTTHDPVWLNHMKSSKFVVGKSAVTFRKWHVDHGPQEWKQTDVWAEVDQLVANNEIRAAAGQLRHYLEYAAAEWCARLPGFKLILDGLGSTFRAGTITRSGVTLGILRIQNFRARAFPAACLHAWADLRQAGRAITPDSMREAAELRWFHDMAAEIRALRHTGATALVVDIGNDSGGDDSGDWTPRLFTDKPVRSARLLMADVSDAGRYFADEIRDINEALAATQSHDAEAALTDARSFFSQQAAAIGEHRCDLSWVWREQRAWSPTNCNRLLSAGYAGGYSAGLARSALGDSKAAAALSSASTVQSFFGSWTGPTYVLADQRSYSSAEMFAAVMQDNRIAKLVGNRTGGDGCGFMTKSDPIILRHSRLRFRVPNCMRLRAKGTNEEAGIVPDISVPPTEGESERARAERALLAITNDLVGASRKPH